MSGVFCQTCALAQKTTGIFKNNCFAQFKGRIFWDFNYFVLTRSKQYLQFCQRHQIDKNICSQDFRIYIAFCINSGQKIDFYRRANEAKCILWSYKRYPKFHTNLIISIWKSVKIAYSFENFSHIKKYKSYSRDKRSQLKFMLKVLNRFIVDTVNGIQKC